jgi:hypothetical protein
MYTDLPLFLKDDGQLKYEVVIVVGSSKGVSVLEACLQGCLNFTASRRVGSC